MNCGSVVAPTLTLDHALPPASDDDDAGQPMVGRRRRATKWGCVCEMTGATRGQSGGRARHGPPRVVVAVASAVGEEVKVAAMTAVTVVVAAIEKVVSVAVVVGSNDWREWWCLCHSGHLCFLVLRMRRTGNERLSAAATTRRVRGEGTRRS